MEHSHNHNEHQESHHVHQGATSKLKAHASALEAWLAPYFAKAPHLPEGARRFITTVAPWLALIFGALGLVGLLGSGLFAVLLSPFIALSNGLRGVVLFITILLALFSSVLSILSFVPLKAMKKLGWDYSFYGLLISSLSTMLSIVVMFREFGGLVGIVIGMYLLFEIRERYY